MKRIAIIIPTRGTIFTRVINAVEMERSLSGCSTTLHIEEGKDTPQVFNDLVQTALLSKPHHILFVEEDTVPPLGSMGSMVAALQDESVGAVCIQYPVQGGHSTVVHAQESGEIVYCGLGCTMIRADIFKQMSDPWFRSDWACELTPYQKWKRVPPAKQYGLYDILFFTRMRKMGYTVVQIPGECEHLRVVENYSPSQNGSTFLITNKADHCNRSEIAIDPVAYWTESLL